MTDKRNRVAPTPVRKKLRQWTRYFGRVSVCEAQEVVLVASCPKTSCRHRRHRQSSEYVCMLALLAPDDCRCYPLRRTSERNYEARSQQGCDTGTFIMTVRGTRIV